MLLWDSVGGGNNKIFCNCEKVPCLHRLDAVDPIKGSCSAKLQNKPIEKRYGSRYLVRELEMGSLFRNNDIQIH